MQHQFNDIVINVHETHDARQWYMTVEEVSRGYGVSPSTIKMHLKDHSDEIREGVERNTVRITDGNPGNPNKTVVYREGVIKLGFFIRSKQAACGGNTDLRGDWNCTQYAIKEASRQPPVQPLC